MDTLILNAARMAAEDHHSRLEILATAKPKDGESRELYLENLVNSIEEWDHVCSGHLSVSARMDLVIGALQLVHDAVTQNKVTPTEAHRILSMSPLEVIAEVCREPTIRKQMQRILTYEVGPPTTAELRSTLAWHAKFWSSADGPNHRALSEVCLIALAYVNETECSDEILYSAVSLYS